MKCTVKLHNIKTNIRTCRDIDHAGDYYADRVKNLFERHFKTPNNTCWSISNQKASAYKGDMRMAVALINVYTQVCKNYADNVNGKPLYAELNKQLRDQTKVQIWLDTEQLLNEALKMAPGGAKEEILFQSKQEFYVKEYVDDKKNIRNKTSTLEGVSNWEK
ncbi:hypothetical protein MAR_004017 [Mya arenaria]|uniref:Uncharacterized protein n=1 Tax=Mya arenaria TaxID=6604 RepID=A0ABY7EVD5_MYAAR|nr:hypothetical protein MAR_004017 [Mya arenaria]